MPFREEAYSIFLQLKDSADHELCLRGKRVFHGSYETGAVSLVNLADEPVARIGNAFDIMQIYLPCRSLDEVTDEHGAPPIRELVWSRGAMDPVALGFAQLILPVLAADRRDRLFVEHLLLALRVHVATRYGGLETTRAKATGGLAKWQERRAKDVMEARYADSLSIADLARECGLSPSHFTRAFRQSTGVQPHRWLSGVRLEAAKRLLAAGDLPLAEIALACGYGDQSYFTRMFSREVGTSPGAWRRCHRD